MDSDTFELVLKAPISHDGATIASLALREPTAGELAAAAEESDMIGERVALIAAVAGVDAAALAKLGARDLMAASEYLARFTATSEDDEAGEPAAEVTIALSRPLGDGDLAFSSLALREPTAGQLRLALKAAGSNPVRMDLELLMQVTGKPTPFLKAMPARDFIKVRRFFGGFINAGPTTS